MQKDANSQEKMSNSHETQTVQDRYSAHHGVILLSSTEPALELYVKSIT